MRTKVIMAVVVYNKVINWRVDIICTINKYVMYNTLSSLEV